MKIKMESPYKLSYDELKEFTNIVLKGGEVTQAGLFDRVKRAEKLIFAYDENEKLIGVSAIKKPLDSYKYKVFSKSNNLDIMDKYDFELGWVFVNGTNRGSHVGSNMVEYIINNFHGKIFATTRLTNTPMQKILNKYGFEIVGDSYPSLNNPDEIVVMVKK